MMKTFKVDYTATLDLSVDIEAKSAADAVKKFWKLDDKLAPETLDFFDTSVEGKFEIKEVRMDGTVPSPMELAKDASDFIVSKLTPRCKNVKYRRIHTRGTQKSNN
jgi:hypothetical protein